MDVERTKRILRPVILLISLGLIMFTEGQSHNPQAQKYGRSNVRIKELTSVYTSLHKEHYSKYLIFPVERQCQTSDFISPPEAASSELVSLWSDLLHKYSFANEEMIPDKAVQVLEKVSTKSGGYQMIPFLPMIFVLLYAVAASIYVILIPIIGCGLFQLSDLIWIYCISVVYRKLGRLVILCYYRRKMSHIRHIKPEQLRGYHFRIPKYFRNDNDAEELFDKQSEETAVKVGEEVKARIQKQKLQMIDSSESEFDLEKDYKEIAPPGGEGDETAGLTEEERKVQKKMTRDVFKRAKGRRQSIRLSVAGMDESPSDEEIEPPPAPLIPAAQVDEEFEEDNANMELWSHQVRESSVYPSTNKDKPLDPAQIHRGRKTLLQEMRDERQAKLKESKKK